MSYPDPHNALPIYLEASKLIRGKNPEYGVEKMELAAGLGYAPAMCMLGAMYYSAFAGLTRDYDHAFRLFQAAVKQDHEDAMNYLGICYLEGLGTEKNYEEAVFWFRKAARLGNIHAQNNLLQLDEHW